MTLPAPPTVTFIKPSSDCFEWGVSLGDSVRAVAVSFGADARRVGVALPAIRGVRGVRAERLEARVGLSGRPAVLLLRSEDIRLYYRPAIDPPYACILCPLCV